MEAVLRQLRHGVGEQAALVGDAERRLPVVGEHPVVVHQQWRSVATALDRCAGDRARHLHGRHRH